MDREITLTDLDGKEHRLLASQIYKIETIPDETNGFLSILGEILGGPSRVWLCRYDGRSYETLGTLDVQDNSYIISQKMGGYPQQSEIEKYRDKTIEQERQTLTLKAGHLNDSYRAQLQDLDAKTQHFSGKEAWLKEEMIRLGIEQEILKKRNPLEKVWDKHVTHREEKYSQSLSHAEEVKREVDGLKNTVKQERNYADEAHNKKIDALEKEYNPDRVLQRVEDAVKGFIQHRVEEHEEKQERELKRQEEQRSYIERFREALGAAGHPTAPEKTNPLETDNLSQERIQREQEAYYYLQRDRGLSRDR